jgi:hypothetical protein
MTQENKRNFLQETAFEEDVNLDDTPKSAKPPHSTEEMRRRWQENNKN